MATPLELARARVWLADTCPYISSALWAVGFFPVAELAKKAGGPIGIDKHWRIYYDPEVIKSTSREMLGAFLLHEIHHVLRDHHGRCGAGRNPTGFNIAGDCEINDDLVGRYQFPDWICTPKSFGLPDGLTAEEYYEKLKEKFKDQKQHMNCGSGAGGPKQDHEMGDGEGNEGGEKQGVSEIGAEAIRRDVARQIKGAPPGTISADLALWADSILEPRIPWQSLLYRYIKRASQITAGVVDYTYAKPARRKIGDVILPRMIGRKPKIVTVMDTSGSMHGTPLARAAAEVEGIAKAAGYDSDVIFVDYAACGKVKAKDVRKNIRGGGGTNMGAGIAEAEKLRPLPDVCIVITDEETPWPAVKPPFEVIVCGVGATHGNVPGWAKEVIVE